MAHQATDNDSESWNPAIRPENNNAPATMTSTEGGLSDLIAADEPKGKSLGDVMSPQSEDLSAWDLSNEADVNQPRHTSLDVAVDNGSPVVDRGTSLTTDSVDKNSQVSIEMPEPVPTHTVPSLDTADAAPSPTLPDIPAAQAEAVQNEAPSIEPGDDSSNIPITEDQPPSIKTEPADTTPLKVVPEYETVPDPTVTGESASPEEEQTRAPETALNAFEHEYTTEPIPTEELYQQTNKKTVDHEDAWTSFEKDLGNTLPSTGDITAPSTNGLSMSALDSIPDESQHNNGPTLVEGPPEETTIAGTPWDEAEKVAPTENEQLDSSTRSVTTNHENDEPTPITATSGLLNDVQSDTATADAGTTSRDQTQWASKARAEVDSDEDDFFSQLNTQTKPIFAPPEAESRFEEGVPLLEESAPTSPQRPLVEERSIGEVFADNDDDDAASFFNSAPKPEAGYEGGDFFGSSPKDETLEDPVVHLTRKSTAQALESAGFALDSPASDASAAAQFEEALNAASTEPKATAEPSEEELAARWEAELGDLPEDDLAARWEAALDDDDLLLETEVTQPVSAPETIYQTPVQPTQSSLTAGLNSPFQTPEAYSGPKPIPNIYAPHQPTTNDLLQGVPLPGMAPPSTAAISSYFSQQPQNPVTTRGESFAERSKQVCLHPLAQRFLAHRFLRQLVPPPAGVPPPATAPPAPKNFYEELPLAPPRSRPASSGRYTPNAQTVPAMTGSSLPAPPLGQYAPPAPPPASQPVGLPIQPTLQPPKTIDPYASLASSAPAGPPAVARYSPQPPSLQPSAKPPSLPRYSPAPPPIPAARSRYASQPLNVPGQNLPFQPRTSSPLAHHEKVSYQPDQSQNPPSLEPAIDLSPPHVQEASFGQAQPNVPQHLNGPASQARRESTGSPAQASPPQSRYAPPEYINEFAQRLAPASQYAAPHPATNGHVSPPPNDVQIAPLRRSQTQSPGRDMLSPLSSGPSIDTLRPASVNTSGSPIKTVNPYAPMQGAAQTRAPTQHLEFIAPNDGQEQDHLERWKGAPIFKFGFGGSVVSCFPGHVPRYSAGQLAPMIQPTPGEPKISLLSESLPSVDTVVQHPGPLKSKSKKKDLIAWLTSKIAAFENSSLPSYEQVQSDTHKRYEEKILLWKVVKLLVENDGSLDSSPEVQKSLRHAIFPNIPAPDADGSYASTLATPGGSTSSGMPTQADAVDPQWLEELRLHLICGDREKAVWGAVDRRLWGHAMLIASTMDKSISKQVTQEFVRREIRSKASNTESLAALYEIFAGNIEESIDELVPPSARAGLQLVNKADGQGFVKNALEGLDKWKDTLGLVLSNRSSEDHQALLALGRLLTSYGRTEAAHVCYMFSRAAVFGGADDPQADITVLGADHLRCPSSLLDEDGILLTEAYEYATSVLGNSPTGHLPHLLAFKIFNARCLVDRGRNSEAQAYCDAVAAALKATTRPSPYYHQHLFAEVEELSARLRQTTSDNGSWISRPSMEKVSGSMWARFNSFVVGDDGDAASTGSGKGGEQADFGPFANVAGTPTISRSPSVSDMYGSYPGAGAQPIPVSGPSKYQPSSQYAPNASPEQYKGRSSMDSQRSVSYFPPIGQRRSSQEMSPSIDHQMSYGASMYGSPNASGYQPTPPQSSSYVPLAPVEEALSPSEAVSAAPPAVNGLFYQPPGQPTAAASWHASRCVGPRVILRTPAVTSSYEPVGFGANTDYAPQEEQDLSPAEEQPKKKSIMDDDDDDLAARAAALQKAENDRKANEAFAKAAEEDAKRGPSQSGKKGWFGGWFGGGKKEENNSGGGPIRAKLGEESSFYYDKDLKKWVNKKDPNSSAPVRATPPPPRISAPPSRNVSSSSMPPNGGPPISPMPSGSRPQSSASAASPQLSSSPGISGLAPPSLPRSVSTGAAMPTPPGSSSGPPPRPSSSLTHASSIDDLIGAPQARKGNTARGKKKGRYVDVMAQ
ncbi:uncharacterized protein N7515_004215 [Penicillium bovifimosum]|uniref:Protein transport protein sec16 n=1 Tax=Penicillium bovifimosum TaxID=126998 RepID=A0A9W9H632_9EURO|nr:uncharacterized protein N7515_004215 [Penicillium bovifimosum]KAJ5139367.1 hypothetical protein N7515_004215 [Penicillium bovifimosum]